MRKFDASTDTRWPFARHGRDEVDISEWNQRERRGRASVRRVDSWGVGSGGRLRGELIRIK
jgi:hypothetical protein